MPNSRVLGGLQADAFLGAMYEHSPFGKVWYVDITNGSDGNAGDAPDQAYASVNSAISAAVATRGDTVVIAPGTYTVTTALNPKAMMTFRAAVVNPHFPTVTLQGNITNLVTLDVSGCRFIGIRFLSSGSTLVNLVNISSVANINGATFEDCLFEGLPKSTRHNVGIRANSATLFPTGLVVRRCRFSRLGITPLWVGVQSIPNAVIEDNAFVLWSESGCGIGFSNTTHSQRGNGYSIRNNEFLNSGDGVGVRFIGGTEGAHSAGIVRTNYFAYFATTTAVTQNSATRTFINNYVGDTGTGGTIADVGN